MNPQIQVTKLKTIPPVFEIDTGTSRQRFGELRDFRWSSELREFMPSEEIISISWVKLDSNEALHVKAHPTQSLMIVFEGSGVLTGDVVRDLSAGDLVVVPAGCHHGFVGGDEALHGLSIRFGTGLTRREEAGDQLEELPSGLESLVEYNQKRARKFGERPLFELLASDALKSPLVQERYLSLVKVWSDGIRRILLARQASCVERGFEALFWSQLDPKKPKETQGPPPAGDSVFDAINSWFMHQMFLLDDAQKATVIDVVLGSADEAYRKASRPTLGPLVGQGHYALQLLPATAEQGRALRLLSRDTEDSYRRFIAIAEQAWDMVDALADHIAEQTAPERYALIA